MKQKKRVNTLASILVVIVITIIGSIGMALEERVETKAGTGEVVQAQDEELKEEQGVEEASTEFEGFRSAIGNMYVGDTLYIEEEGTMIEALKILQTKDRQILVKDIATGEQFWKDRDKMIEAERSEYGVKYYVKEE